jgi:hypothetical protein
MKLFFHYNASGKYLRSISSDTDLAATSALAEDGLPRTVSATVPADYDPTVHTLDIGRLGYVLVPLAPAPAPAIPQEVTKWQFWREATTRFAARGITKDTVRALLPQLITDPVQLALAFVDFDDATAVRRSNALLPLLAQHYSITTAELDALFQAAVLL